MLTKQDLIDLLNAMQDVPNDAPVLIDMGDDENQDSIISPIVKIQKCIYSETTHYRSYKEPAAIFPFDGDDQIYGPYKHGIQIVLGDSI